MSLGCDWQTATLSACALPGPTRSIFIKDRSAASCVLLSVSINLKAPAGQPPPHCCNTVRHSQAYVLCKHTTDTQQMQHIQTFYALTQMHNPVTHEPIYSSLSHNEHHNRLKQFADNACSLLIGKDRQ